MPDLTASLDVELAREPRRAGRAARRAPLRRRAGVRARPARRRLRGPGRHGRSMNAHEAVVDLRPAGRRGRRAQRRRSAEPMTRPASAGPARAPEERRSRVPADHRARGARAALRARPQLVSLRTCRPPKSREGEFVDCDRDPRRHPAAEVDRAGGADAVRRPADCQAREERLDGQGGRRRRGVRRHHAARTMQEKQSELKQAEAEIEQATAQARITTEQNATELMRAKFNIERAQPRREQGRHRLADRERAGAS